MLLLSGPPIELYYACGQWSGWWQNVHGHFDFSKIWPSVTRSKPLVRSCILQPWNRGKGSSYRKQLGCQYIRRAYHISWLMILSNFWDNNQITSAHQPHRLGYAGRITGPCSCLTAFAISPGFSPFYQTISGTCPEITASYDEWL